MKTNHLTTLFLSLIPFVTSTYASLVVHEDFSYSLTNGSTMTGVSSAATGLTGPYFGNNNGGSSTYQTNGLTFSSKFFATSGGAVQLQSSAAGDAAGLGVSLFGGTVAGTLYCSYLVNFSALSSASGAAGGVRVNSASNGDHLSSWFSAELEASAGLKRPGVRYDATSTPAPSGTLAAGTTYLVIGKFTRAGMALSSGSPGVGTTWVLTSAGYDNWINAGAGESQLGVYAAFSATESVTTGAYTFDNSRFIQLLSSAGAGGTAQTQKIDELRYGTTLADVVKTYQGVTYYVSAAGNDSNSGTSPSTPWATISKVNSVNFAAGATILFRGGDTFTGNLQFDAQDLATAAAPITIGSYGSGRATLSAGTGDGIFVHNRGGFVVSNINVSSPSRTANLGSGIVFYNDLPTNTKLNYIRVDQATVSGFGWHGVFVCGNATDGSKSGYTDVRITNVEAFDNAHTGIYTTGYWDETSPLYANSNVYVGFCKAYSNPGQPGYWNHSGSGIFLEDVDGGVIEYCVARDNGALCDSAAGGPIGIWAAVANNVLIQYNESHHNKSKTADGGGFDFDGGTTNSTMQFNYSHDNKGAGYLVYTYPGAPHEMNNLTVRYNISQNDGLNTFYAGLYTGGTMAGPVYVYNNVFYSDSAVVGTAGKAVRIDGNYVHFRNNLLVTKGSATLLHGSNHANEFIQGNNYWNLGTAFKIRWGSTTYTSLSAWRTATGKEMLNGNPCGSSVDPMLSNPGGGGNLNDAALLPTLAAYRLEPGSPMVDAGLNLNTLFALNPGSRDFYGGSIPQNGAYDIGIHEYDNVINDDIIKDNTDSTGVTITGTWQPSTSSPGYQGANYLHDDNTGKGSKSVRFTPTIPSGGSYQVFIRWTAYSNRASNVPIDVVHAGGTTPLQVNQRLNGGQWVSLGVYSFNAGTGGSVLIGTAGTNGYVIADAVRFVPSSNAHEVTYGFEDITQYDVPLSGVHGGIDFGSGKWRATNETWAGVQNYAYFPSGSVFSSSFMLPAGHVLKSIRMSSGANSSYTISDGVNPPLQGTISTNTPITVNSNWTQAGTTVTVNFSAGWNCVIDQIVYDSSAPPPQDVTYGFEDITQYDVPLSGVHSGIDFGSGKWRATNETWAGVQNYAYFPSGSVFSSSFTLPAGNLLKSIRMSSGANSSYTISDGVNPQLSGTISANTPITVSSNWTQPGTIVTINFSAGWNCVIDQIVYSDSPAPPPPQDVTYGFDDITQVDVPLSGVHSGIDFGSGKWRATNETWADVQNYAYFPSGSVFSSSFTLPAGNFLKSIRMSSGANSSYTISDGVNPQLSGTISANTPITVDSSWTEGGTTVTVNFSAGWNCVIDQIVYGNSPTLGADAWSHLITFKDFTDPGGPSGGWNVAPVHSVLLPTGKILMIGYRKQLANDWVPQRCVSFLFDPSFSGSTFNILPLTKSEKFIYDELNCAGHAQMSDGRVFAAGGERWTSTIQEGLEYAQIYNPQVAAPGGWTRIAQDMEGGLRWYPAVTRMPDERMLVTTGFFDWGTLPNLSVELFNPTNSTNPWTQLISHAQNQWTEIQPPHAQDYTHVYLLPQPITVGGVSRQVIMSGNTGRVHFFNYSSSFTDPNNRFAVKPGSRRPGPTNIDLMHGASSALLSDGRFLVVGGTNEHVVGEKADIYNPVTDTWTQMSLGIHRHHPTAVLLPDESVLVINGHHVHASTGLDPRTPQVIYPLSGKIVNGTAWPESEVRGYHNVATLLPDGRVLTAGGKSVTTGNTERPNLRFYSPHYLADSSLRPVIGTFPAQLFYGTTYNIGFSNGPVHKVVLMGLSAVTHSVDQNQRIIKLFDNAAGDSDGQVSVVVPATKSIAPPGHYMLFVLRRTASGMEVPSVAKIVQLK